MSLPSDRSTRIATGPRCPSCNDRLFDRHCKYVCPRHGVVFDCSDPFA